MNTKNRPCGEAGSGFIQSLTGWGKAPTLRLGPIFKKDENHPFISLFLEMGRRWATRWLGSARRSV